MSSLPSYRFASRPWWIASHIFLALCVLGFVRLGFWQLSRLAERKDLNTVISAREDADPVPITQIVTPEDQGAQALAAQYRRVSVTGVYRHADQVLVRNRSSGGLPGYWVVTPVRLEGGPSVAVNRGWIPFTTGDEADASSYAPPSGSVTITGLVRETQHSEGFGPVDPPGTLSKLSRVDLPRLQQQVDVPLLGVYVDLQTQQPAQSGDYPTPVPAPALDEGSHLSYALQWYTFAILTAVVYVLLLRRVARRPSSDASPALAGADET